MPGTKKITTRNIVHDRLHAFAAKATACTIRAVSAAPAEIASQPLLHLIERRLRRLIEQRLRRHDHAISTVAALRGLLGDEQLLYRIRLFGRSEPFESRDRVSHHFPAITKNA